MTDKINVSEVSEILRMQLEGIDSKAQFEEIGKVLQVSEDWLKLWGDRAEFRRQIIRLRLMRVECHRRLENTSAARE